MHGGQLVACEGMWLRKLLSGLFKCELEAMMVRCDNQSGIKLSENPVSHDRSKHIDIRYHFLRDCVHRGTIRLEYIQTMRRWRTFSPRHFADRVL